MTDIPFPAPRAGEETPLSDSLQEGSCGKYLGDKVRENTFGFFRRLSRSLKDPGRAEFPGGGVRANPGRQDAGVRQALPRHAEEEA